MPEYLLGIVIAAVVLVVVVGLFLMMRRKPAEDNTFTVLDSSRPMTSTPISSPSTAASNYQGFSPSAMSTTGSLLTIQDIFMIKGRGLVVTGKVESGRIMVGQLIQISSPDGSQRFDSQVKGLEAFHKRIDTAQAGDNVGVMLDGLTKDQIQPGMVITSAQ